MSTLKRDLKQTSLIALIYALRVFGFMVILPIIVLQANGYAHASAFTIGLAIGSYGLTQAIFQIILGRASDRLGRKPIVYFGLCVLMLGSLLAWSTHDLRILILARAIQGSGAIGSTLSAWCADLTAEENRTKCMALIGGSIGLSFTLSIVLSPILANIFGLAGLFLLTAILAALASIITSALPSTSNKALTVTTHQSWFSLMSNGALNRLFFGILSLHAIYAACFMFVPNKLTMAWHFSGGDLWQLYLPLLTLCYLLAFPAIAYFEHKKWLIQLLMLSQVVLILALVAFAWHDQHAYFMVAGLGLLWLAFTVLEALLPSLTSQHAPAGQKGLTMGLFATAQYFGVFLGGAFGGWFYHWHGWHAVLILSALLLAPWLWSTLTFPKRLSFTLKEPLAKDDEKTLLSMSGVFAILPSKQPMELHLSVHPKHIDHKRILSILTPFIHKDS